MEKDGDVFVISTDAGGKRTVYRPVQNILESYWGIKIRPSSSRDAPAEFKFVMVKPAAPIATVSATT